MPDIAPQSEVVQELGPDIIFGMPEDQTLKMRGLKHGNITIWEEYNNTYKQKLNIIDIIELMKDVPQIIREYIDTIILSPFDYPYRNMIEEKFGDRNKGLVASVCHIPGQIIIYNDPRDKEEIKHDLRLASTLCHEAAHIMDEKIIKNSESKYYSSDLEWIESMNSDHMFNGKEPAPYCVCRAAENELVWENGEVRARREDFAVSVVNFLDNRNSINLLMSYPNRYETLVKLIGDCRKMGI